MGDWTVVGREAELARLDRFVREARPATSIVLIGGPGIGKTTVWEAALHSAREQGIQVLAALPGGSDAQLPFGGLIDLCDRLGEAELSGLPAPQRAALEHALMRGAAGAASPSSPAVEPGLLGVVRALAERSPVLIALDDVQWLDRTSERAVTFVARRLGGLPVGFLLARRPDQMADPDYWVRTVTSQLLGEGASIEPKAMEDYIRCFRDPRTIAGSCADFRSAASTDLVHDEETAAAGQKIECPVLVLWGTQRMVSDPLSAWQQYASDVHTKALPTGHFLPEEAPDLVSAALRDFLD